MAVALADCDLALAWSSIRLDMILLLTRTREMGIARRGIAPGREPCLLACHSSIGTALHVPSLSNDFHIL